MICTLSEDACCELNYSFELNEYDKIYLWNHFAIFVTWKINFPCFIFILKSAFEFTDINLSP